MPDAEIITIAEYVAEKLTGWVTPDSGEPLATVKRSWEMTHDLGIITGRKIDVYGAGYADGGPVTRYEGFYDVTLIVVCLERYEGELEGMGTEGVIPYVPPEWVDERVTFVEEYIFNRLGKVGESDAEAGDNPLRLGHWWTNALEVTVSVDPDMLRQQKCFWSETEITFRRVK